uniref:Si:ch211-166g5.4 n=1 Tax=Salarias fasciatus TaxID=181472 RepID=A0A672JPX1_SALFA
MQILTVVLLTLPPLSSSEASVSADPGAAHLCHLQQAVQEQLQPAAAPVGPHWGTHEGQGQRAGGGSKGGSGRPGGGGGGGPRPTNPNPNPVRKNHACETCGKAFRDVYHLNRHRLSHSDEKPFSCPICQQRFKRKDRMSHHVRSHQGGVEKPYICPHCGKAFSRPDHLNSHVRQVHSSERPFKCPTCESSFATKDRLRAHMIRHEEKVPCHICGKLLSAAYITDHMRVHNQSQHHACHLCNRSKFLGSATLSTAAWKDSPGGFGGSAAGGVLVCHLCGVHCKTPTQLQGHMGTHSNSQAAPAASNVAASSSVSLSNMVTAPTVYVTGNTVVDLLVTDCSSIAAPQTHS